MLDAVHENGVSLAFGGNGVSGANGNAHNGTRFGKKDTSDGKQPASAAPKKPKAPKVKKPTPAMAGADLDVTKLREVMSLL